MEQDEQLELTAATIGAEDSRYIWSSSFPSIATVDSTGVVTGASEGRVVIMARGEERLTAGTIEIQVIGQDAVIITAPPTDTIFNAQRQQLITWDVIGSPGTGSLSLSTDGGVSFATIENAVDLSAGELFWTPPQQQSTQSQCVLKFENGMDQKRLAVFSPLCPLPPYRL